MTEVERLETAVKKLEIDREAIAFARNELTYNLRNVGLHASGVHIEVALQSLLFAREALTRELAIVGAALGKARMQNKELPKTYEEGWLVCDVETEPT